MCTGAASACPQPQAHAWMPRIGATLAAPAASLTRPPLCPAPAAPACAVCVNGGMVTCLFLGTKLWEHRKALRLEAAAARRQKQRKAE